MFRVSVLASGSKGNCTIVATNRTRIVVDVGLSCREIVKRMRLSGQEPENLDAVLITHEHQDHVQGLSVLARRWNVPVYMTEATHDAWKRWMSPRKQMGFNAWLELRRQHLENSLSEGGEGTGPAAVEVDNCAAELPALAAAEEPNVAEPIFVESVLAQQGQPTPIDPKSSVDPSLCSEELFPTDPVSEDPTYLPCLEYFRSGISFQVGDISITPFTIPHDAADPVGYVLESEGMRVVIATDLGYLPPNVRMHLERADVLIIESNYDVEMLRDGPYPWAVKQRVLSRVGHLSNDSLGEYLANEYDGSAHFIILAHISENNNLPELARLSAERALENRMRLLGNRVLLASQTIPLESIYL